MIILVHRKCQVHQVQPGGFGYWICLKELKDLVAAPRCGLFFFFSLLSFFAIEPARVVQGHDRG